MSNLRDKVKELAEVAALVPENLQATCFEVLLRNYLTSFSEKGMPSTKAVMAVDSTPSIRTEPSNKNFEEAAQAQADVALTDLHVKARKFMEKNGISISELNNLFYKEGTAIKPLYEDLKTTKMSEVQVRITLLQALHSALVDGEFAVQVEDVRTECRDRKALDSTNFAANYKNNSTLFDFNKYDKNTKFLRLSEDGKKELARFIKELQ